MANSRLGFLLLLLLVAILFSSPAIGSSDAPFMVAHKKVSLARLKTGVERVSVSIDLYNEGSATAYDVSLNDDGWSQDVFELVSGSASKTWERLDAGSTASHSFVLESKVKGMFHGSPAVIKFRVPTKAALQEAYSTPMLPLDILADRPPEKKFEWAKRLVAKYGSLVSVLLLVTLFIYVIATPSKSSAAKASKKRR
ncbi:translocon-associated protein subunit beta [Phoenix dactylifera]|uniref:Translocon-associated protein subunit beta n=1 Tax=Phoenix dactylifera TaxID=42345 RepID=A0A8B7C3R0_PHODC|nr:translocon-associated protein subunit beta [Phoenix dactylifera]